MSSLEKKMANATKWSSMAEVASKLVSPIVNMILARALTPSAFGVVATVSIIITFAEIFQDAGFQKYLIQHNFASDDEYEQSANVAFWSNLIFSFLIWFVICLFRIPLSVLVNNTEDLGREIMVASVSLPIFAFSSIQIAICRRKFNFRKLFWVRLITSLIPLVITVPLAFVFRNHWALIIGTIVRNVVQSLILLKDGWQPKFNYSFKRLRSLLSFCVWTLAESVTIWLTANVSTFVVTRILGMDAVGLYKTSMSTVSSITGIISGATLSVLFSALSRLQNDEEAFYSVFYSYQKIVAIFVLPLGVGMWLYKDLLVKILLGNQWLECVDFVGMYAFATVFSIVTNSFFSELYRSKGKPKISMLAQIIYLAFLIPAVILASKSGFNALCITITVAVYGFFVVHYCLAKRFFGIELRKLVGNIFSPLLASGAMAIFSLAVQAVSQNIVIRIISAALCVPVYLLAILLQPSLRSFLETNEFTADTYKKLKNKLWKNKLDQ